MRQIRWIVTFIVVAVFLPLSLAAGANERLTGTAGLERFLPRSGEMPGFKPSGPVYVAKTIARDVAEDDPAIEKTDRINLRKDGFHEEVFQSQVSTGKTNGVVGVTELRSASAAAAYRKFDFGTLSTHGPVAGNSAQVDIVRFSVPGVSGAEGAALVYRTHVVADANIEWVQGDCVITVGDVVASHTPLRSPLIHAAQAIYQRAHGVCAA